MKCPLSITGELTAEKEFIGAAADCLKGECALWNKRDKECSFLTSSKLLNNIDYSLAELVKLIHCDVQVRK